MKIKDALGLLGAGLLAVGAALAGSMILGVAPSAHALPGPTMTVQQYLSNVRALGWEGSNAELLHNGALICAWRDMGYSEDDARHKLYMSSGVAIDANQTDLLMTVFAAEDTFCWWYAT